MPFQDKEVVNELKVDSMPANVKNVQNVQPECICLSWSADGQTLFAGYTDNMIRVWRVPNVMQ